MILLEETFGLNCAFRRGDSQTHLHSGIHLIRQALPDNIEIYLNAATQLHKNCLLKPPGACQQQKAKNSCVYSRTKLLLSTVAKSYFSATIGPTDD
jgi:hypothetical protein